MSSTEIKSLLHFDDLLRDEVGIEVWRKSNTNVTSGDIAKFGYASLYSYTSTESLLGTNNSGIWNLNSSGDYEIEFFIYPIKHGNNANTRYMLRIMQSTTNLLYFNLNTSGTISFICSSWGCSVTGTTVLSANEWHHIVLRISNQIAKVFIDGAEDISAELLENVTLSSVTIIRLNWVKNENYACYMDEFVFRHSAGTEAPIVPTKPYSVDVHYTTHKKRNFGTTKSLLHFDYPYFNEPNDGLGDEIGLETWSAENDNVKLYGTEIPIAGTFTPKFGYRCLYSYNGAVLGTNTTGIWNMNSGGKYEIEFFVNPTQHGENAGIRHLLRLYTTAENDTNLVLTLSLTIDGHLEFSATAWNITEAITGTTVLSVSIWQHILIRVSKQKLTIFLDGENELTVNLPENITLNIGQVRIGYFENADYPFYMDEFAFRHSASKRKPTIPTEPYNGYFDAESIGGYGTGADGELIITEDTQINSYGLIDTITDSRTFTVKSWINGTAIPDVGSEIMLHVTSTKNTNISVYQLRGLYSFAKIAAIDGKSVVLDRDISIDNGDDFILNDMLFSSYYVQAITVPNYSNLTINSGCTVSPLSWNNTKGGGIVAFRCTGNCTINGSIITHGKGAVRYDLHQMTHSQLVDRFLCSQGGGIFITCGGTFTANSTARLGATWSGLGDDINGATGYGGKGRSYLKALGGKGGVGGGGGGILYLTNGSDVGKNGKPSDTGNTMTASGGGGCGGIGGTSKNSDGTKGGNGGCQGIENCNGISGGYVTTSSSGYTYISSGGGGAPGGNGGAEHTQGEVNRITTIAGACIILICQRLSVSEEAISTGGQGLGKDSVSRSYFGGGGGAGTGFCYIAAGELVDE